VLGRYDECVQDGLILGIESSCDETSAAVVRAGVGVLANVVASQMVHASYGGVVPELASREHLRAIVPVTRSAMARAGAALGLSRPLRYEELAAVAVTEGPGLAGALLVGITFAKSLAFAAGVPLIAVNHLEGHIHAVLMESAGLLEGKAPLLALVVSGGHTHLYLAERGDAGLWRYRNVGRTVDDAAGEAFDKVAKLLGLPYPGGPWIDALARFGVADRELFAVAQVKTKATGKVAAKLLRDRAAAAIQTNAGVLRRDAPQDEGGDEKRFDLSFSGLKTAVRRYVETHAMQASIAARVEALRDAGIEKAKPGAGVVAEAVAFFDAETLNLIASFQDAAVRSLVRSTFAAAEQFGAQGILVSGGVAANSALRSAMSARARERGVAIAFPSIALSTDNAAMIAAAGWPKFVAGQFAEDSLEPTPQLRLG
jgi:N6-L-threonylcarbamoyladenine synthase